MFTYLSPPLDWQYVSFVLSLVLMCVEHIKCLVTVEQSTGPSMPTNLGHKIMSLSWTDCISFLMYLPVL